MASTFLYQNDLFEVAESSWQKQERGVTAALNELRVSDVCHLALQSFLSVLPFLAFSLGVA